MIIIFFIETVMLNKFKPRSNISQYILSDTKNQWTLVISSEKVTVERFFSFFDFSNPYIQVIFFNTGKEYTIEGLYSYFFSWALQDNFGL